MIYHHFTFNPVADLPLNCIYLQLNGNLKVNHTKNYSTEDAFNKIFSMLEGFHTGEYNVMINNENVFAIYFIESASEARVTYDPSLNQVAITHNIFDKSIKVQTDSDSTLLNTIKKSILSDIAENDTAGLFGRALMGLKVCVIKE